MKSDYKKTLLGSLLAFILGTSCCWISSLAVWLGGATVLTLISKFVNEYYAIFLFAAILFFIVGLYQIWKYHKWTK